MFNNKPRTSLPKRLAGLTLVVLCALSTSVFASFGVLEEGDIDYYGNATIPPFKEAVEGTEALTSTDRAFLSSLDQSRIVNRWYLRFIIGNAKVQIKDIEGSFTLMSGGTTFGFPLPSFDTHLLTGLLAWGHLWESWAVEAEILVSRHFQKNLNPLIPGLPVAVYIEERPYALFFNVQYILPHVVSFYPTRLQIHFDAGFGPAYKTTDVKTSYGTGVLPGQSQSKTMVSLAGTLGFGARYQITPHILVDVVYRYFSLGSNDFPDVQGLEMKAGLVKSTALFFGGTYQF